MLFLVPVHCLETSAYQAGLKTGLTSLSYCLVAMGSGQDPGHSSATARSFYVTLPWTSPSDSLLLHKAEQKKVY